jgi:hypothetical protein
MKRREWLNRFAKGGILAGLAGMVGVRASAESPSPEERLQKIANTMTDLKNVSCADGTWNYDPYFHGMANAMIVAESVVTGQNPVFLDAPAVWLDRDRPTGTPAGALERLSRAMKSDPEYAWGWHCNIASAAMDEGLDHAAANRAAARFMHAAFGVDTSDQG